MARKYTEQTFKERLHKLRHYCLNETEDALVAHSNMVKAFQGLDYIIFYVDMSYVEPEHVITLVWCSVTVISYFYLLTNLKNSVSMQRLRYIYRSIDQYEKLVNKLESHSTIVIKTVVKHINDQDLWQTEQLCSYLVSKLLLDAVRSVEAINAVLDNIEGDFAGEYPLAAREKINCLTKAIQKFRWASIHVEMINRLLNIYYRIAVKTSAISDKCLKRGLTFCLRTLMQNMTNEDILIIIDIVTDWVLECESDASVVHLPDFCDMLEQACHLHHCVLFWDTLKDKLLTNILKLVMSRKRTFCLLGYRVLHSLLDRHSNGNLFTKPMIFWDGKIYEITVGNYHAEDKVFLKRYREILHNCFIGSIRNHGASPQVLEKVYKTLALFVAEIPAGHTAASMACIAMNIQELAILEDVFPLRLNEEIDESTMRRNHCHAIVISVMSLICWVCKARVFNAYLDRLVMSRAKDAPFLNPPICRDYSYALGHVLWNERNLFFEDWEVRYGLWKCFRRPKRIENTARQPWARYSMLSS